MSLGGVALRFQSHMPFWVVSLLPPCGLRLELSACCSMLPHHDGEDLFIPLKPGVQISPSFYKLPRSWFFTIATEKQGRHKLIYTLITKACRSVKPEVRC